MDNDRSKTKNRGMTPQPHTYLAELYAPLFYASKEGKVIETEPTISATALMHAIGYEYYDLEKRYLLTGEEATTPAYRRLRKLPLFVSEMTPISVDATERTFRTTSYTTERTIVSQNTSVGEFLIGTQKPVPRKIDGSNAGWHKERNYIGISPGSTFQFTVWTPPKKSPPEKLGFRLGIKRTGEIRALTQTDVRDKTSLNQYLLQTVYDLEENILTELVKKSDEYRRGNDIRTSRFVGVDRNWVTKKVIPQIFQDQSQQE